MKLERRSVRDGLNIGLEYTFVAMMLEKDKAGIFYDDALHWTARAIVRALDGLYRINPI